MTVDKRRREAAILRAYKRFGLVRGTLADGGYTSMKLDFPDLTYEEHNRFSVLADSES